MYGKIVDFKINHIYKTCYNYSETNTIDLSSDVHLMCGADTIDVGIHFFGSTTSDAKRILGLTLPPKRTSFVVGFLEKNIDDVESISHKKIHLLNDLSSFEGWVFQPPFFKNKEYQYNYNGVVPMIESRGNFLESITVTEKGSQNFMYIYLLYNLNNNNVSITTRTVALPQKY